MTMTTTTTKTDRYDRDEQLTEFDRMSEWVNNVSKEEKKDGDLRKIESIEWVRSRPMCHD